MSLRWISSTPFSILGGAYAAAFGATATAGAVPFFSSGLGTAGRMGAVAGGFTPAALLLASAAANCEGMEIGFGGSSGADATGAGPFATGSCFVGERGAAACVSFGAAGAAAATGAAAAAYFRLNSVWVVRGASFLPTVMPI